MIMNEETSIRTDLDVLAFAPHPDDVELYCSGTLLLLRQQGFRTGIIDLTRGELSTRGTLESRARETAEATAILGVDVRVNLELPDGGIANTTEQRDAVIRVLRRFRPRAIFLPWHSDRHPDHAHASELIRDAHFLSGLANVKSKDGDGSEQTAWRPPHAYYYMLTQDFDASVIIDVTDVQQSKLAAIHAYSSQFYTGTVQEGVQTYVSSPAFLAGIIGRSQRLGFLIGGEYGEGFQPLHARRFRAEWLLS
jgi:N-acetylglucosamine malate deacetylase 1